METTQNNKNQSSNALNNSMYNHFNDPMAKMLIEQNQLLENARLQMLALLNMQNLNENNSKKG